MKRCLILALAMAFPAFGVDLEITTPSGPFQLMGVSVRYFSASSSDISLKIVNKSAKSWYRLEFFIDVGVTCDDGRTLQIAGLVSTALGWHESFPMTVLAGTSAPPLPSKACSGELFDVRLKYAKSGDDVEIRPALRDAVDFGPALATRAVSRQRTAKQLEDERVRMDAERAEKQRIADLKAERFQAELKAKAEAQRIEDERLMAQRAAESEASAARERKAAEATEARRKQALLAAEAQQEEQRHRLQERCSRIYSATHSKKLAELTVDEDTQVKACRGLGMYQP